MCLDGTVPGSYLKIYFSERNMEEKGWDFKYELFFPHTQTQAALRSPFQKNTYFLPFSVTESVLYKRLSLMHSYCEQWGTAATIKESNSSRIS